MKCKNCGKEVKENWKICPWCKAQLGKIAPKCPNCGEEVDESWDICPVCEYPLHVSNVDDIIDILPPTDSELGLVADDIAEAEQREQEQQNVEYKKNLDLARVDCIRKKYDEARQIYDSLAKDNPLDINAYIGYVRIESQNYTLYQGAQIEEAIRVVKEIGRNIDESKLDKEYREYLTKREEEFARLAAEEEKKAEAERKAKEEAARKAREEAERKRKEELERARTLFELQDNGDGTYKILKVKNKSITNAVIPSSVTSIGESAFKYCKNLMSITILNSVTTIGRYAFWHCESLTSVTIPSSVTSIGESAFKYCKNLTSITIPNSVTSINRSVFSDCYSLTNITIPNSVTSIGGLAFYGCKSLTNVTIPKDCKCGDNAFPSGCKVTRR